MTKKTNIAKSIVSAVAASALVLGLTACAPAEQEQQAEPEVQTGIKLDVTADGWDGETSTPVIAQLTPQAEDADDQEDAPEADQAEVGETADPIYHQIEANAEQTIELEAGIYELVLISPVNADGSIYSVPDETTVEAKDLTEDADAVSLELIPADQVTQDQMTALIASITVASESDPDAVPTSTLERATENAKACPNVSAEALDAAEAVAAEAVESGDASAVAAAQKPATSASTPLGNTGSTAPAASAPANNSGSGASAPAASAPAHTHNWVAQTTQKYVVDQKASEKVVCSCGNVYSTTSAWGSHNQELGRGNGHAYSLKQVPEQGHYETVTTGYKCSCGATK